MAKNPQLKRAYDTDEYTPEQIAELAKCSKDPLYFMKKYIKVIDPKKGAVPFELFEYQTTMVNTIHTHKDTVILASRQLGKCVVSTSTVNTVVKPTGFRKFLLKILDRKTHDQIFNE
jgi:hypothetical protein